ncbi:hypothetical protein ACHAXT_005751 [Thalassiosira profunda]
MSGSWSAEADRQLWATRSQSTAQLAASFGRSSGAIRSRLKHLNNPSHKAYLRLHGANGTPRASGGVVDLTGASPFAAKYIASKSSSSSKAKAAAHSAMASAPQMPDQPPRKRIDPSTLNSDQTAASHYILGGKNAFLTGAAGVGKSYLLNFLIQELCAKYENGKARSTQRPSDERDVVVAAATGIAATHIGGVTIHSWAGVRLGKGGARVLVPRVQQNEAACRRWRRAKVLVLDEVSMIDGMLFEALDAVGREVRNCPTRPFGGIQLVLSGDFLQLPPISLSSCGFAFEAPAWSGAGVKLVELTTAVRQSGDRAFADMLNRIRVGSCPPNITEALQTCHVSRKPLPSDGIVPTKLYCTNRNVDEENNRKLAQLPGRETLFRATDDFKGSYDSTAQRNLSQMMDRKMPSELRLKIGAQVILTRNMPHKRLVNGSRGIVKAFKELTDEVGENESNSSHGRKGTLYPVVHFSNGVVMTVLEESVYQGGQSGAMVRSQLPLKLAWSLTVHKSQGMTIERAELQLDDAFDYGQVYVALSRVTSLAGLWVRGGRITQSVVKAHPKVMAFYRQNGSTV